MNLDRRFRLRPGMFSCCATLLGAALLCAGAARASLGSNADSISADREALGASLQVTKQALYVVHELSLPNGTRLREYLAPGGIIFAVAWNGPALPDLSQALGAYFPGYLEAARANANGHNHLAASRADLVVVSAGHMRAFQGYAYLASALPAGVSTDELR